MSGRGGARPGAGRKPGAQKAEHRSVRKLYRWTPAEYERIKDFCSRHAYKEAHLIQDALWVFIERIDNEQYFEKIP